MKVRDSRRLLTLATLLLIGANAPAEAGSYYRKGTFAIGGGFNIPVSEASDYLNSSGSMHIAGGRHLNAQNTVQVEWDHNWLGIDPSVIERAQSDSVQFDNAYASSWSVTLNLVHRINPDKDVVPWVTGGFGFYKRNIQITQTALVYYPPIFDPWWGWIDGGWAPGEAVAGSRSATGFGFNVGLGFDFSIENDASLFVDARYHHAFLDGVDVTVIPIMAGIRW